jgi:hypothetical protein
MGKVDNPIYFTDFPCLEGVKTMSFVFSASLVEIKTPPFFSTRRRIVKIIINSVPFSFQKYYIFLNA